MKKLFFFVGIVVCIVMHNHVCADFELFNKADKNMWVELRVDGIESMMVCLMSNQKTHIVTSRVKIDSIMFLAQKDIFDMPDGSVCYRFNKYVTEIEIGIDVQDGIFEILPFKTFDGQENNNMLPYTFSFETEDGPYIGKGNAWLRQGL